MRKKIFLSIIALMLMIINFPGCSPVENATTSGSKLVLEYITGTDLDGNVGSTTIFSDVVTTSGSIVNDEGTAQVKAVLLDPEAVAGTHYQAITIDRVQIKYYRVDGLSEEGRDVPYGFSQDVNVIANIEESVEFGFVLVQHTAKMEPPLSDLRWSNEILKMEAEITFYGKDGAGRRVQEVTGRISVWFGNFADNN